MTTKKKENPEKESQKKDGDDRAKKAFIGGDGQDFCKMGHERNDGSEKHFDKVNNDKK